MWEKLYSKAPQRKELHEVREKVCLRPLFMLRIPRQEAVVFEVPPLIIGCQGDVSAGAINIHHMCWLRNVCVLTGMPKLWKTHTHAMTHEQDNVCFVCNSVFTCVYIQ